MLFTGYYIGNEIYRRVCVNGNGGFTSRFGSRYTLRVCSRRACLDLNDIYRVFVYRSSRSLPHLPDIRPLTVPLNGQRRDLRTGLADPADGSLDHLPAPWTLGWSSAMAVPAAAFDALGGFCEDFRFKGSEDLELCYRLWRTGASFGLVSGAEVLHLPHRRDRGREEALDRLQEREMLAMHPTPEMEALCAFDGANANPMLELLARVDRDAVAGLDRPVPAGARGALRLPRDVAAAPRASGRAAVGGGAAGGRNRVPAPRPARARPRRLARGAPRRARRPLLGAVFPAAAVVVRFRG